MHDRKALWVVRELGLPTIVTTCTSCRSTHHHPTGKFRVNASGKLLDVWLLIGCDRCGRTSKIPLHERVHVQSLNHERLVRYEHNDPTLVRDLTMDTALAGRTGYRLDWTGTWALDTDLPFHDLDDPTSLQVFVRFELPAPIRLGKLLTAGFGLSRSTATHLVTTNRLHLPTTLDTRVRADFTFLVTS